MRAWSLFRHERTIHAEDYAKFEPTALPILCLVCEPNLAPNLHGRRWEGDDRTNRTATMLDTALLIASALSLALMMAFSELP